MTGDEKKEDMPNKAGTAKSALGGAVAGALVGTAVSGL